MRAYEDNIIDLGRYITHSPLNGVFPTPSTNPVGYGEYGSKLVYFIYANVICGVY